MARSAAINRDMAVRASVALRNAKTAAARFQAAEEAYRAGDVHAASLLYQRAALSRQSNPAMKVRAKSILDEYREMALAELAETAERIRFYSAPSAETESDDDEPSDVAEELHAAIDEVNVLVKKYEHVPVVNRQLERELNRLITNDETVGRHIHQPIADGLVRDAKRFEAEGHICCAYLCYREAGKLMTCDAAKEARRRLYELRKQPGVLQAVAECERIRECHALFDKAQRVGKRKTYRKQAAKIYKEIIETAPRESEVHQAAVEELGKI